MRRSPTPLAGTRSQLRFRSLALLLVSLGASRHVHAQASPAADGPSEIPRLIGLSVAASGGPRDTLGLLVATVTRDGPADRAGITTGSRILAVNGLQVRLAPNDIGRRAAADSALIRFDRALRVTPPGSDVILRVAGGGLTRLVNVPVAVRRIDAPPASGTVRTPSAIAAPDTPAQSDTNGERATGAPPAIASAPPMTPSPAPRATGAAAPVATSSLPAPPAAGSVSTVQPSREPRSVNSLADALGEVQLELRRLARESHSLATSDSLAELDAAVGALRRRLRTIATEALPAAPRGDSITPPVTMTAIPAAPAAVAHVGGAPIATSSVSAAKVAGSGTPARLGVPGLELAKVSGELAAYLGSQGESALSVIRASDAWEPMHTGDVIIQVDGTAPDPERLRIALESHRRTSITLLRRGRSFTVLLGEADAH